MMMMPPAGYAAQPPVPQPTLFEQSQIIAWVGEQPIQVGDVMPLVEQTLAPYLEKLEPHVLEIQREEIEQQKKELLKKALESAIESKLLYQDFLRAVPAEKKAEILPRITSRVNEQFDEKELPQAMKKAGVESPAALDAKLRTYGSSLEQQKRLFAERVLGQSGLSEKIDYEPEITHQAMLDDYRENIKEYEFPAKVRWEKITVRFASFAGKDQAWAALGDMGNEVLRGAPLSAVAKRSSQGVDASDGGYHDWTSKGSLASDVLNEAIFSLPVGQLSERLEDDQAFHIVRVIERTEPGRTPFTEAQVEIKEKLRKAKVREQVAEYVEKLKNEIYIWTVVDDESVGGNQTPVDWNGTEGSR
jgi:parvulin-like peptidyl-prolyl isomerase